ncbi:MAG TPA: CBS domain-containing protein [bacterium]|nr:CBS domain-containing protein [bacterium]HOL95938.1 CBS domain-containing protein [bacterium]HPO99839.1 CBS domain-containing protein [bacterium]HXK92707.1 CBS domain-containing protein [bacterium]
MELNKNPSVEKHEEIKRSIMEDKLSVLKPTLSVRIAPDTPVKEVIHTMVDKKIGAVLIVEEGRLVGIFSERDVLKRVALRYNEVAGRPIREFMTPNPEALSINHSLAFTLNRMDVGGYRHIPVTDDQKYPTGIVAARDILRYLDHKCLGGPE